eukprot:SAG31_NODE_43346_length_267_cov_0.928571_2_plen_29_part_01
MSRSVHHMWIGKLLRKARILEHSHDAYQG